MLATVIRNALSWGLLTLLMSVTALMGPLSIVPPAEAATDANLHEATPYVLVDHSDITPMPVDMGMATSGSNSCCACDMSQACAPKTPDGEIGLLARDFGPVRFEAFESPPQSDPPRS